MLAERRFQPSERNSYPTPDGLPVPSPTWNYIPRSQNVASQDYNTSSGTQWNNNNIINHGWPGDSSVSASSSSYPAAATHYRHSGSSALSQHSDHSESSSRAAILTTSPSLPACLASPTSFERAGHQYTPSVSKYPSSQWRDDFYALDGTSTSIPLPPASTARTHSASPSARASSRSSSTGTPPVKLEPEESASSDCFVMEFTSSAPAVQESSSLAPPTEVPLRATQASKAMRKMMGVFRLNPFSMHEGGGQALATWSGEDARPLEEEPQMFEFQLDLGGEDGAGDDDEQPRGFSSGMEGEVDNNVLTRWTEDEGPQLDCGSHSQSDWMDNESAPSYPLPPLRVFNHSSHSPSLSSSSSRRTPFDMSNSEYSSSNYTLPSPHSCSSSADNLPSLASMARKWSVPSSLQAQFMIQ
ncbi:hypothetical protein BJ138DRAFT_1111586 [Hygrophoropsis aurantiaca]|uniref:Uncharacterized protein n=1 Tax=Hygrophoropsis aurantiaca TaxID=72124 RepID=A0ACB8AIH6_9AGAM|nr:hypothetical protein BJ138DRAFT_1111586 [Hygrophoropsis aurantiaca]